LNSYFREWCITHLGTITQGTNQDQEEETNVEIKEDLKNKFASTLAQEVESARG
jgi:hypothetical protein